MEVCGYEFTIINYPVDAKWYYIAGIGNWKTIWEIHSGSRAHLLPVTVPIFLNFENASKNSENNWT